MVMIMVVVLVGLFTMRKTFGRIANRLEARSLYTLIYRSELSDTTKELLYNRIDEIVDESKQYINISQKILNEVNKSLKKQYTVKYYKRRYNTPFINRYMVSIVDENDNVILRFSIKNPNKLTSRYILKKYGFECKRIYEYALFSHNKKYKPKHIYKRTAKFKKNKYTLSRSGRVCLG